MTINWKDRALEAESDAKEYEDLYDNYSGRPSWSGLWMAVFITAYIAFFVIAISFGSHGIDISQETADRLCVTVTNDTSAIAEDSWDDVDLESGNLVCVLPSYDSTQHIIIKTNAVE